MSKISTFCLLIFVSCCLSCNNSNDDVDPDILPNIDDEFNLELWEVLSPVANTLNIIVSTLEDHECSNTTINHNTQFFNQELTINLNGLDVPNENDCFPDMPAPVSSEIFLNAFQNGMYDVEIKLLDIIQNKGILDVTDDYYRLEMETTNGFYINKAELRKVPNHTFWGYIALDKSNLSEVSNTFLENIDILKNDYTFEDGNYGYFSLEEDGKAIDFDVLTSYQDNDKFIFRYSGDINELTKLVSDYRNNEVYGNEIEIKMTSFEGVSL